MSELSKEVDPEVDTAASIAINEDHAGNEDSIEDSGEEDVTQGSSVDAPAEDSVSKKKKSKKAKLKKALGVGSKDGEAGASSSTNKLTPEMAKQLLEMNPSLKGEFAGMDKKTAAEAIKKLDAADLMTGLVCTCNTCFNLHAIDWLLVRGRQEQNGHGFL